MDPDLGMWICMVLELEWTLSKRLCLAYSMIDLSLLQRQSASQEKHGSMGDSTFSSISLLGIFGPGDRRLCMRLAPAACASSTFLCYI